ncbi:MAG: hypothetical protein JKY37_03330 [Nannocystaceae bacterium]|nr:hypothetical protein [Nannocystaceae bacterium]
MTEIAQLFESALRSNHASLLRTAAINTIARMPPGTTLGELLASDAAEAIRALTLDDLAGALREAGMAPVVTAPDVVDAEQSREEQIYRRILDTMAGEALTIGQLSKRMDVDVDELRGYLTWMKKMGKVQSLGRARATRYQVAP